MTAFVLVVPPGPGPVPGALQPAGTSTAMARLAADCGRMGSIVAVLSPARYEDAVRGAVPHLPVIAYDGTASALQITAEIVHSVDGPVGIVTADVIAHRAALAEVFESPLVATGVLSAPGRPDASLRVRQRVVESAGSSVHGVTAPTETGLHVLKVADSDRIAAASAARELGRLAARDGWDDDVVTLLLVGLVRGGVSVSHVPLGSFRWARAHDAQTAAQAARAVDDVDEEKVKLAGAARPGDGPFSTLFTRRLSRLLTPLGLRWGLTPNTVTVMSIALGLAAGAVLCLGTRSALVAGALLLHLSLVVDRVDGEIARYTRQYSVFGGWLDGTSDRVKDMAVIAGLAVGAMRADGQDLWLLACITLSLQMFMYLADAGFTVPEAARKAPRPVRLPLDHLADIPGASPPQADRQGLRGLGDSAVRLSEGTSRSQGLRWAKLVLHAPIGERWLLLSVGMLLGDPRLALVLLLGYLAVALAYQMAGRLVRSFAAEPIRFASMSALVDMGPVTRTIRVLLSAPRLGNRLEGRFVWMIPAMIFAMEALVVTRAMAVVSPEVMYAAYAYLASVAYHRYDTIYRMRHLGPRPSAWADLTGGGFDGRLLIVAVLLVVGGDALVVGTLTVAAYLAVLYATENVVAWRQWAPAG